MRIFSLFGLGKRKILCNCGETVGTVVQMKTCWWLKINTKPVRRHSTDGAVFSHIVVFTYAVDGNSYTGSRYVSYRKQCANPGSKITVYYNRKTPDEYYVDL